MSSPIIELFPGSSYVKHITNIQFFIKDPNYKEKRKKNTESARKSRIKLIEKDIHEKEREMMKIKWNVQKIIWVSLFLMQPIVNKGSSFTSHKKNYVFMYFRLYGNLIKFEVS